jgi:hypothetical protein
MRLEEFVLGARWQELPFDIKVALAHIWLREQEADKLSARLLWTTGQCFPSRRRGQWRSAIQVTIPAFSLSPFAY